MSPSTAIRESGRKISSTWAMRTRIPPFPHALTVSDPFLELVDALVGTVREVGESQGVEPVRGVQLVEHVGLSPANTIVRLAKDEVGR